MSNRDHDWIVYVLVVLLIVVLVIAMLVLLGPQVNACFCGVNNNLRVAMPQCSCPS
jgi:Flp pilus assembly pilin Flp